MVKNMNLDIEEGSKISLRSSYFINVKRNATQGTVSVLYLFSKFTVSLPLSALYMCAAGIKSWTFTYPSQYHVWREQALFDSSLIDLALPILCNWLCILPFTWQLAFHLPCRGAHATFEGGTASDFHVYPRSMLGCLLSQRPAARLYGILWSQSTSAA